MTESHTALALYFDQVISKTIVILETSFLTHRTGILRLNSSNELTRETKRLLRNVTNRKGDHKRLVST